MKKLFTICAIAGMAIMLNSCQRDPDVEIDPEQNDGIETRSSTGKIWYDNETEQWYETGCDPYRMENIQKAFSLVTDPTSSRYPSNASSLGNPPGNILYTHLVLRIKPKTREEMDELLAMQETHGIEFSTVRPDWVALDVDWEAPSSGYEDTFIDEDRYYHIEEPEEEDEEYEEEYEEDDNYMLPVIYAIWPQTVNAMPLFYSTFERIYYAWLPDYSNPWHEYIEKEAFREMFGDASLSGWGTGTPSGKITVWDNTLQNYLPIVNVIVKGKIGSKTHQTTTNEYGEYVFSGVQMTAGDIGNLWVYWYNNKFKVCRTNNDAFETCYNYRFRPNQDIKINSGIKEYVVAHIWRAANTFVYDTGHGLYNKLSETPQRLQLYSDPTSDPHGTFYTVGKRIKIRYIPTYTDSERIFGTVAHELGHSSMCNKKGAITHRHTHEIIQESWAEFVKWYLTKYEYDKHGISRTSVERNVPEYIDPWFCSDCGSGISHSHSTLVYTKSHRDRQDDMFKKGDSREYTGFFIDLFDDFNQALYEWLSPFETKNSYLYPNDDICLPLELVQSLAMDKTTYEGIKNSLNGKVGQYSLTSEKLKRFFHYYDRIAVVFPDPNIDISFVKEGNSDIYGDPETEYIFTGKAFHLTDDKEPNVNGTWYLWVETPPPGRNYSSTVTKISDNSFKVIFHDPGIYIIYGTLGATTSSDYYSRPMIIKDKIGIDGPDWTIAKNSEYFEITGNYDKVEWSVSGGNASVMGDPTARKTLINFTGSGTTTIKAKVTQFGFTEEITHKVLVDENYFYGSSITLSNNPSHVWIVGEIGTAEFVPGTAFTNNSSSFKSKNWSGEGTEIEMMIIGSKSVNFRVTDGLMNHPSGRKYVTISYNVTYNSLDGTRRTQSLTKELFADSSSAVIQMSGGPYYQNVKIEMTVTPYIVVNNWHVTESPGLNSYTIERHPSYNPATHYLYSHIINFYPTSSGWYTVNADNNASVTFYVEEPDISQTKLKVTLANPPAARLKQSNFYATLTDYPYPSSEVTIYWTIRYDNSGIMSSSRPDQYVSITPRNQLQTIIITCELYNERRNHRIAFDEQFMFNVPKGTWVDL